MIWLVLTLWLGSNIVIAWAMWAKPLPASRRASLLLWRTA